MSNKYYHNYKSYSETKPEEAVVETPLAEESVENSNEEPVVEVVEEVIEEVVAAEEPTSESVKHVIGFVSGCSKLNVREGASTDSEVVGVIAEGSEVVISESESTADFYKVCAAVGFEGYCMKKFIVLK